MHLAQDHAGNEEGKKLIIEVSKEAKYDLSGIVGKLALPTTTLSELKSHFPTYDDTKLVCFIYTCLLFKKLNKHYKTMRDGSIKDIDILIVRIVNHIFDQSSVDWARACFSNDG
jgi:hypothetical protein